MADSFDRNHPRIWALIDVVEDCDPYDQEAIAEAVLNHVADVIADAVLNHVADVIEEEMQRFELDGEAGGGDNYWYLLGMSHARDIFRRPTLADWERALLGRDYL